MAAILHAIYQKWTYGNPLGSPQRRPEGASYLTTDEFWLTSANATYYPFVGDPKEEKIDITAPQKTLPEGQYTLKFRAVDAEGKIYEKDNKFIIDNTLPKLTFKDKAPGKVYELKDSDFTQETLNGKAYNAFWLHANLYDEGTAQLAPLGITQSSNTLWYYYNQKFFPDGDFPVEANGDVKFGIEKSDIENGPATMILFPMDAANNAHLLNDFYPYAFVKEGTPYVVPTYDKHKVYQEDTLTMTLTLNNVEKLMKATYDAGFYNNFEFQNVSVNPEFQKYAQEHGWTVTVDQPVVKPQPGSESSRSIVNVGAKISGDGFTGLSGDTPFLDVKFKLVDDFHDILWDTMDGDLNTVEFSYTKFGESTPTNITLFNQIDSYKIIMKHSKVDSYIRLEGFKGQWGKDLTKVGATVYAQDSNGVKYPGTIDSPQGYFSVKQIPLSKDPIDIVVEAPGHLKSIQKVTLGTKTTWGEEIGEYKYLAPYQPTAAAGDVNGDGVIDVLDVKKVANKIGTQDQVEFKVEDLNQDGIINETDMKFLVKNLYKSNPDATVMPKEEVGGKYSTDFFNELGIASTVNTLKNTTKSKNTAALSWIAAVNATQVIIEQSSNNGATWSAATTQQPVAVNSNNAVVTGLSDTTSYQFRVRVVGGLNEGISNIVKVTTGESLPSTPGKKKEIKSTGKNPNVSIRSGSFASLLFIVFLNFFYPFIHEGFD